MATITSWKSGITGDWNDSTKWDNGVPNATGTTANIVVAGTYTVTIDGGNNFTVDILNLNNARATLQNNGDLIVNIAANITAGTFNENGTLDLSNAGAIATVAAGAKLNLSSADVIGGTLSGPGAIKLTSNSTTTFDGTGTSGLSIAAGTTVQILDGSRLSFGGPANSPSTISNAGTISLNAVSGQSLLTIDNQVTLTGGGNIVLSDANNGNNSIYSDTGGATLDNVNNTISGAGTISPNAGLAITNESAGTIDASSASFALNINNLTVTNLGLVESTASGGLALNSMTLDDTGGGTLTAAGAGNAVTVNSSTIKGGTLTTTGGGVIQTGTGTSNLDLTSTGGMTISSGSMVDVSDNSTLQLTGLTGLNKVGVLTNAGTITLAAATNSTLLAINNHIQLKGGGQIVLSDAGNGNNLIYSQANGSTLENVNNTISGAGTISSNDGLAITNDSAGIIDANSTAFALNINSLTVTNKGLVESTGSAGLDLNSMTLDGTGGGTLEAAGALSVVNLSSSTIRGGTLTTTGGGTIQTTTGQSNLDLTATTNGVVNITAGSTLSVSNNTTLQVTGLTGNGRFGTLNNAGTIGVDAGANISLLAINNQVKLQGGGQIVLSDSANNQIYSQTGGSTLENVNNTISGAGTIMPNAGLAITNDVGGTFSAIYTDTALNISTPFTNKGTLEAVAGATLNLSGTDTIGGTIAGAGRVELSGTSAFNSLSLTGSGTLDVAAALGNTTGGVAFATGSTETLELDTPVIGSGGTFLNPIAGFATGEQIDLRGLAFGSNVTPTYSGTTLTVTEGSATDTLTLTSPNGMTFQAADDGHGGTVVRVTCFAAGTQIRIARGEVIEDLAIQHLEVGDMVVTASGERRPIKWLGHRYVDCVHHPKPEMAWPILVQAGAFAEGRPSRALMLSPHHSVAMMVGTEVLIPIRYLINGSTITQVKVDTIAYWHVELDSHDVILAEGLPTESYMDVGNRSDFDGEATVTLHPEFNFEAVANYCRPLVTSGPLLSAARLQCAPASETSPAPANSPIQLLAGDKAIEPIIRANVASFVVPAGARDLRLVSPTFLPGNYDRRRLGIMIETIVIDDLFGTSTTIALNDPGLFAGFHDVEQTSGGTWRWTDGDAHFASWLWSHCTGAFVLRIVASQFDHTAQAVAA